MQTRHLCSDFNALQKIRALTRLAQGAEGTEVSMTVQPRGGDTTRQVALTRRKVKFNPVTSRLCGGMPRTGYLRVSTFSKQTAEGVGAAIQALKVHYNIQQSLLRCTEVSPDATARMHGDARNRRLCCVAGTQWLPLRSSRNMHPG